jgi:D-alanyl-D-alanine carboxypeptidase
MFIAASGEAHGASRKFSRIALDILSLLVALALALAIAAPALAKPKFSAIAVDARSGRILFSQDPDGRRHPASLTKVMTLYMLFDELKAGRVSLSTKFSTSRHASSRAPSKLGLKPGQTIRVDDAIKALVTLSANDVASVIAENLGGSESAFAARMTRKARELGMNGTVFVNASGLPDPRQITTARDMATLGLRVQRDFPQYYPYFRTRSFKYGRRIIRSHNRLLGRFEGTDGIKTGYIRASGFNLTTSARRGDKRLVGVVMGGSTGRARDKYMMVMLERAFPKAVKGSGIALAAGRTTSIATVEEKTEIPVPRENPMSLAEEQEADVTGKPAAKQPPPQPEAGTAVAKTEVEPETQPEPVVAAPAGSTFATVTVDDEEAAEAVEDAQAETEAAAQQAVSALPDDLPFAVKAEGDVDPTAAIPNANTWHIQVGAYPSKESAQAKLVKCRETGIKALSDKQAFTMQVQKGAETVYRARFSGFSAKSAKSACQQLTRKGISCLMLAPQT